LERVFEKKKKKKKGKIKTSFLSFSKNAVLSFLEKKIQRSAF
jgi:hypothetical protein